MKLLKDPSANTSLGLMLPTAGRQDAGTARHSAAGSSSGQGFAENLRAASSDSQLRKQMPDRSLSGKGGEIPDGTSLPADDQKLPDKQISSTLASSLSETELADDADQYAQPDSGDDILAVGILLDSADGRTDDSTLAGDNILMDLHLVLESPDGHDSLTEHILAQAAQKAESADQQLAPGVLQQSAQPAIHSAVQSGNFAGMQNAAIASTLSNTQVPAPQLLATVSGLASSVESSSFDPLMSGTAGTADKSIDADPILMSLGSTSNHQSQITAAIEADSVVNQAQTSAQSLSFASALMAGQIAVQSGLSKMSQKSGQSTDLTTVQTSGQFLSLTGNQQAAFVTSAGGALPLLVDSMANETFNAGLLQDQPDTHDQRLMDTRLVQQQTARPGVTGAEGGPIPASSFKLPGMQTSFGQPGWAEHIGRQILLQTAQGSSSARIRLDPPELGSLTIRIQLQDQLATVNFSSPHAVVRDALEQQTGRLQDMFREQGMDLLDVSVSDQSGDSADDGGRSTTDDEAFIRQLSGSDEADTAGQLVRESDSLIDDYA